MGSHEDLRRFDEDHQRGAQCDGAPSGAAIATSERHDAERAERHGPDHVGQGVPRAFDCGGVLGRKWNQDNFSRSQPAGQITHVKRDVERRERHEQPRS